MRPTVLNRSVVELGKGQTIMDPTAWIAAIATMRKLVGVYLALGGNLNAKQAAALATDLATLDRDLKGLADSLAANVITWRPSQPPRDDPMLIPTESNAGGKLVSKAAVMDAVSIAAQNAGEPATPGAAQYVGQAAKEGFSGVLATGTGESITFTVFLDGHVVGTSHGNGDTDTQALGRQFGVPA